MITTSLRYSFLCLLLAVSLGLGAGPASAREEVKKIPYGNNAAAGKTVEINGVPVYYEVYGSGEPMLIIHPNGGDISTMAPQIEFFAKKYQVIAADSRGFGKTPMGTGKLTYEQITADLEGLLEHLKIPTETIVGWSDGGIIGLMLAIHHPERVKKLAITGANLNPEGAEEWAVGKVKQMEKELDSAIAARPNAAELKDLRQTLDLMSNQPQIPLEDLAKITAPTLVMAGDKDLIKLSHTAEIFRALPHAQMCIFPGATHQVSYQQPDRFNRTVDEFLSKPFTRPDSKDDMQ